MEAVDNMVIFECREKCNINDLSLELLLLIFSFFTPQQLCSLVAPVCTKWHQLSREPLLWRKLDVIGRSLCSVLKLVQSAPLQQLRTLEITAWDDSCDALLALVSEHCPSLVTFVYRGTEKTIHSGTVEALAERCPAIEEFAIPLSMLVDRKYSVFARFPKLRVLSFSFDLGASEPNTAQSESDLSLAGCKQLVDLKAQITSSQAYELNSPHFNNRFRSFLRVHNSILTSLIQVSGRRAANDSYIEISKCIHLQHLMLCAIDFLTDGALLSITANLKQLRRLELWSCSDTLRLTGSALSITGAGLVAALCSDDRLDALTELSFTDVSVVSDDVVAAIADRFARQLRRLTLRSCANVTDTGVLFVLSMCSDLEYLELSYQKRLTDATFRRIRTALPKLNRLSMTGCAVDTAVIDELKVALPDLRVYP